MSQSSQAVLTEIEAFASQYPRTTLHPHTVLIANGEEPQGIFFLSSGEIVQTITLINGDQLTLTYYKAPSFLPMIWAFGYHDQIPTVNRHEFTAVTPVTGHWAPTEAVLQWLPQHPAVLMDLTARLCRGFDATLAKWEEAHQNPATILIGNVLLRYAYRELKDTTKDKITLSLTHQEISDFVGLTRETTSRVLSLMTQAGIITTGYREIGIPSLKAFREWLATN